MDLMEQMTVKELELIENIKSGRADSNTALQELYNMYSRLFYKLSQKYANFSNVYEIDDLMQEAFFPLKKAAETFDNSRGIKFMTYLIKCTARHFNRCIKSHESISSYQLDFISKIKAFKDDYFDKNGFEPSRKSIAMYFNISVDFLKELESISETKMLYFDAELPDGGSLYDIVPDNKDFTDSVIDKISAYQFWSFIKINLKKAEFDLIQSVFIDKKHLTDIAKESNVQYSKLTNELNSIRKKLRKIDFESYFGG